MTTIAGRYDRSAAVYQEWWAPVLEEVALGLLGPVARHVPGDGSGVRLLDVGTGTGMLAIAAAERWPGLAVVGIDGSQGMLDVARGEAGRRLGDDASRVDFAAALADRLPYPDGSFDLVVSSFVMQLVPHRPRALREARRVLRPGGVLAFVTWLAGGDTFAPDEAFNDVLDELEVDDPAEAEEARSGDFLSAAAAAAQVRRASFRDVSASESLLVQPYDPATYIDFLEQYAERETFAELSDDLAGRVRSQTSERLRRLPRDAFTWRAPVVTVVARRP